MYITKFILSIIKILYYFELLNLKYKNLQYVKNRNISLLIELIVCF